MVMIFYTKTDINGNKTYLKFYTDFGVSYIDDKDKAEKEASMVGMIVDINALRNYIGQSLVNQNYASVNYRYGEDTEPSEYVYKDTPINEGIVYDYIKEYNYQACETPYYTTSKIYNSLGRLESELLVRLLRKNDMYHKGYYHDKNDLNEGEVTF